MNQDQELFSPQQSLDVIAAMIRQVKGNVKQNSFYFLLWGWTIVVADLGVYSLLQFTDLKNPFLFYTIVIPSAIISMVYGARQEHNSLVLTHLDKISKWIWIGFGITTIIMVYFGQKINYQINPVILTCMAVPTFVSGVILRFAPLKFGGIVFWVFGVLTFLVPGPNQFLLSALAVAMGYLIPGYMLKARKG